MGLVEFWGTLYYDYIVPEFISPQKGYTFSSIVGKIIPKSVKCIHSATKIMIRRKTFCQFEDSADYRHM